MRASRLTAVFFFGLALLVAPRIGSADEAPPPSTASPTLEPILARASRYAAQFEEMKRRGSFTMSGRMDELDGSGHVDGTKEMVLRSVATPTERFTEVLRYLEDGADKTAEAQKKAAKRRADRKAGKAEKQRDLHLPFLASEQPRYVFTFIERDPRDASRVRVGFVPRAPAEDAVKGSAWIDEASGEVVSLGFSLSKNPTFIDHIDVTMRFDLQTPLGRAPSKIDFDVRGGFLVIRKHYRGSAMITEPRLGF